MPSRTWNIPCWDAMALYRGKRQKVASPGWACSPGEKNLEFSKEVLSLSKVMVDCWNAEVCKPEESYFSLGDVYKVFCASEWPWHKVKSQSGTNRPSEMAPHWFQQPFWCGDYQYPLFWKRVSSWSGQAIDFTRTMAWFGQEHRLWSSPVWANLCLTVY